MFFVIQLDFIILDASDGISSAIRQIAEQHGFGERLAQDFVY